MLEIIIAGLILLGGCIGSFFAGRATVPKEINHHHQHQYEIIQETDMSQHLDSKQNAINATVIVQIDGGNTNRFINVQVFDITNISISRFTNFRTNWVTNILKINN